MLVDGTMTGALSPNLTNSSLSLAFGHGVSSNLIDLSPRVPVSLDIDSGGSLQNPYFFVYSDTGISGCLSDPSELTGWNVL